MPAKGSRKANNAVSMAETILDKLDSVPWPMVSFLELTNSQSVRLHTFRSNDPEVDRLNSTKGFHWVGCSSKGASKSQVVEDLNETMARIR